KSPSRKDPAYDYHRNPHPTIILTAKQQYCASKNNQQTENYAKSLACIRLLISILKSFSLSSQRLHFIVQPHQSQFRCRLVSADLNLFDRLLHELQRNCSTPALNNHLCTAVAASEALHVFV